MMTEKKEFDVPTPYEEPLTLVISPEQECFAGMRSIAFLLRGGSYDWLTRKMGQTIKDVQGTLALPLSIFKEQMCKIAPGEIGLGNKARLTYLRGRAFDDLTTAAAIRLTQVAQVMPSMAPEALAVDEFIMPEIIKFEIGENENAVSARDLHESLASATQFSVWIVREIMNGKFVEHKDFEILLTQTKNAMGGRPPKEYAISLDMACKIALKDRSPQGDKVREYFISKETQLNRVAPDIQQLLPVIQEMHRMQQNHYDKLTEIRQEQESARAEIASLHQTVKEIPAQIDAMLEFRLESFLALMHGPVVPETPVVKLNVRERQTEETLQEDTIKRLCLGKDYPRIKSIIVALAEETHKLTTGMVLERLSWEDTRWTRIQVRGVLSILVEEGVLSKVGVTRWTFYQHLPHEEEMAFAVPDDNSRDAQRAPKPGRGNSGSGWNN